MIRQRGDRRRKVTHLYVPHELEVDELFSYFRIGG